MFYVCTQNCPLTLKVIDLKKIEKNILSISIFELLYKCVFSGVVFKTCYLDKGFLRDMKDLQNKVFHSGYFWVNLSTFLGISWSSGKLNYEPEI
jgi:hypothetical protein